MTRLDSSASSDGTPSSRSLINQLELLHRPPQRYLDDDLAPDIDLDLLRQLVRRQLLPSQARLVYGLVHAFRSWDEAHTAIIVEEFRARRWDDRRHSQDAEEANPSN